jgi:hypothetical protein
MKQPFASDGTSSMSSAGPGVDLAIARVVPATANHAERGEIGETFARLAA